MEISTEVWTERPRRVQKHLVPLWLDHMFRVLTFRRTFVLLSNRKNCLNYATQSFKIHQWMVEMHPAHSPPPKNLDLFIFHPKTHTHTHEQLTESVLKGLLSAADWSDSEVAVSWAYQISAAVLAVIGDVRLPCTPRPAGGKITLWYSHSWTNAQRFTRRPTTNEH